MRILIKTETTIKAQLLTKTSMQHMEKNGLSIFGVLMFAVFIPTAGADISTEPDKKITITSTPNTSMSSEMKDECLLAYTPREVAAAAKHKFLVSVTVGLCYKFVYLFFCYHGLLNI